MIWYQWVISVVLLLIAGNFLLNLCVFRRPGIPLTAGSRAKPLVSVLIPARNEECRLGPCLESICAQSYPNLEILVLDDHSEDGTAALIRNYMQGDERIRLLAGEDLPAGWTGKAWACSQLAREAKGMFLLFTDADTRHAPDSVGAALALAEARKADLVSLWPRQITGSWAEILVIPFVHVLLLFFLPHWMPGRLRSLGAANGQFMFFRAAPYRKIGGHAAVRAHLVEDVGLAREIKVAGMRLVNADGSALVECRMYENAGQLWEGFTKNLRAGFEDSLAAFLFLNLLQFLVLLAPFLILLLPVWRAEIYLYSLAQVLFILLLRLALACRCRQPYRSVLLHPLGQAMVLAIAMNSWFRTASGKVRWKGRCYGKPQKK